MEMQHVLVALGFTSQAIYRICNADSRIFRTTFDHYLRKESTNSIWIAGSIKHTHSWGSRRVTTIRLIIMMCFGTKRRKIDPKMGRFFVVHLAV